MRYARHGIALVLLLPVAQSAIAVDAAENEASDGEASPPVVLYQKAVAQAAAGEPDAAMQSLAQAVAAGYQGDRALRNDPALAALREREDWAALRADFEARNPWLAVIDFKPRAGSPWTEYAAGWTALAEGNAPSPERGADPSTVGHFGQLQAQRASLVGDYDYAHANYFGGIPKADAARLGLTGLYPALPALARLVEGRNVVMFNETHGHSNQRAANFMFVRELRKLGFTHLALETLAYTRTTDHPCASSVITDDQLHSRGYATSKTGYYTDDPVFGELVRMALAEGYTLVAYEHGFPDPQSPAREQEQARNIACVFEGSPDARIVVIGGGAHISKAPDDRRPPGMMGMRLAAMLETEPLAISNAVSRLEGFSPGRANQGYVTPSQDGELAGQPYFADNRGGAITRRGYDRTAFIPLPEDRSADAGWLRLGGWRVPAPQVPLTCERAPCLLEARRVGEDPEAVPGDRCVIEAAGQSCQLFLAPGDYEATLLDADSQRSAPVRLLVERAG
ncbi:hypothetical protein GCM10011521_16840 [Arenimonas soli]|uniref:Uncharacterized protein n=1 Tax=Arenimonas soli TaxID=2269504 RepID=A0ABQ1HJM5_9GAMM|nr:hypothetical protein [Arenimonas soli]GGA79228.1 hypothetical protein GCM10011521_16840 [Arenimonas soli]